MRLAGPPGWVDICQTNIGNRASIERALDGADAAVNLVGILFERGRQSFEGVRDGAALVAEVVAEKGIDTFVHMSAVGTSSNAKSRYNRTRGEADEAVRAVMPGATILRPSIVFGPEDQFFNRFAELTRRLPFLPSIGGGKAEFQPIYVGDVAEAIGRAISRDDTRGKTYELGGPKVYTLNEIYDVILKTIDRKRFKLGLPFFLAKPLGYISGVVWRYIPPFRWGWLGDPPITGDQVETMRELSLPDANALSATDLGLTRLETVESIVPTYLWRFRPYGEFYMPKEA